MIPKSKRTKPVKLFQSLPNTDYSRLIVRYAFQDDAVLAFSYKESADRLASTFSGGYDDLLLASMSSPPLTAVRQPLEQMGAAAVAMAIELIGKRVPQSHHSWRPVWSFEDPRLRHRLREDALIGRRRRRLLRGGHGELHRLRHLATGDGFRLG